MEDRTISAVLKDLRHHAGLTQAALSKELHISRQVYIPAMRPADGFLILIQQSSSAAITILRWTNFSMAAVMPYRISTASL